MSETQLIWLLATGFLLFFIAIGLLVIRLLSWFGWSKYLPAFAWDRPIPPDARRFSWASMFIGRFPGGVSYRNAMNIWIDRSEEHTSELQSLMRISYAVFCLKKKNINTT